MDHILVTGFEPFDGRHINASWIVASRAAASVNAHCIRLPVRWGAPQQMLQEYCRRYHPRMIIAFGEGGPEGFRLETLARNQRQDRPDNTGTPPASATIDPAGPARRDASFPLQRLFARLKAQEHPGRLSNDAGRFLCEETLYVLEGLRESDRALEHVAFIHVPPFETAAPDSDDQAADIETTAGVSFNYAGFARALMRCSVDIMASPASLTGASRQRTSFAPKGLDNA